MIFFSVALLVIALALAVLHWLTSRSDKPRMAATAFVAVSGTSGWACRPSWAVVRIGDAGAEAVWGRGG